MKFNKEISILKSDQMIGMKVGNAKGERGYPPVLKVVDGGLAFQAGVTPSTHIISVNGEICRGLSGHAVHEMVREVNIGSEIKIVIRPTGQVLMQSHTSMTSLGSSSSVDDSAAREKSLADVERAAEEEYLDEHTPVYPGKNRRVSVDSLLDGIDGELFAQQSPSPTIQEAWTV
eukprot:m.87073 g.87073  ORF g.87073 m.87073 type:complete len:174 (-) comp16390_c0_seq1:531-1052(-)